MKIYQARSLCTCGYPSNPHSQTECSLSGSACPKCGFPDPAMSSEAVRRQLACDHVWHMKNLIRTDPVQLYQELFDRKMDERMRSNYDAQVALITFLLALGLVLIVILLMQRAG